MSDHPRGSDQLLTSLKILGRVRQHERVSTTGDIVRIDGQSGLFQAMRRWWRRKQRKNLEAIGRLVDTAFSQLDMLRGHLEEGGNRVFPAVRNRVTIYYARSRESAVYLRARFRESCPYRGVDRSYTYAAGRHAASGAETTTILERQQSSSDSN